MNQLSKKSTFYNSSLLIIENIIRLIVGLFLSVWMARSLGPESYGSFVYIISFVGIFTTIYVFGNEDLLVKDLKMSSDSTSVMSTAFLMRLMASSVGFVLCNFVYFILNRENPELAIFIFILSSASLFKIFQAVDFYFIAKQNLTQVVIARNIVFLFASGLKLYFLLNSPNFSDFIWVSAFEVTCFGFIGLFLYSRSIDAGFNFKEAKILLPGMLKQSLPLMLVAFSMIAMSKIDQIMIAEFKGNEALGQYSVVVKLVELCGFIPLALISTYFPKIMSHSEEEKNYRFSYLFGLLFWISFGAAIIFTFMGSFIVNFLYGAKYLRAGEFFPYYAWLMVIFYYVLAQQRYLIDRGQVVLILKISGSGLFLNLILNYSLIPKYGIVGAIVASFMSYLVVQILGAVISVNIRTSSILYFKGLKVFLVELIKHKRFFP